MSDLRPRVLEVLGSTVSPINARVALERACEDCGLGPGPIARKDLPRLTERIAQRLRLFADVRVASKVTAALSAIGEDSVPEQQIVQVAAEDDIVTARSCAREMCERRGAPRFAVQRATTAVSELARNIVSYTPGGEIRLAVAARVLEVVAADRGKGIPNVEEILAGRYRSRTGLGLGILGVKRLATRFEVVSGPNGTRVTAELAL